MTPHINAKENDIAPIVLVSGDPNRIEYIAKNFLEDAVLVSDTRKACIYTGMYKGTRISVAAHGMGMPSMGIYAYELFHFYGVEKIIRLGTAGAFREDIDLLELVLAEESYTLSNYAYVEGGEDLHCLKASLELNQKIQKTAMKKNLSVRTIPVVTSDLFEPYVDFEQYRSHYPENVSIIVSEMESFALFYMAKKFHKQAACLLLVVNSPYREEEISSGEKEKGLSRMIALALDSVIEDGSEKE